MSKNNDKYAYKAKYQKKIKGQTFTADANERWVYENAPSWLKGMSPAEASAFKQMSKRCLKDAVVIWDDPIPFNGFDPKMGA